MKKNLISILMVFFIICSAFVYAQDEIIQEANLYLDMMEYQAAIDYYSEALLTYPNLKNIRKKMAYAYFQLEKNDEALKYLKQELEMFPDNEDAYDLLIYILFKCQRIEGYYKFLDGIDFPGQVVNKNPNSGSGDFILGTYSKDKKEFSTAKNFFRRALAKGYNPVKCFVQLADIEFIQENLKTLFAVLAEARESIVTPAQTLNKESGLLFDLHFMYGLSYYKLFRTYHDEAHAWAAYLQLAVRHFEEALKLKPDSKASYYNLGCIHYNLGQFKNAAEYFTRTLEHDPGNSAVKIYFTCSQKKLSESLDEEMRPEKCPEYIELSKDFIDKPNVKEYQYIFNNNMKFVLDSINHLGLEYIKSGKFHEALRRYRNGLKIYPDSPEINYNMGMIFFWLNYLKAAEDHALCALREPGFFGRLSTYRKQEILKKEGADRVERRRQIGIDAYGRDEMLKEGESPVKAASVAAWTFTDALKAGNYFLDAYDLLGNIYFRWSDFNRSILAYTKVIEIDPDDAMGHYNLGCAYSAVKDERNAEKEWKQAIAKEKEASQRKERREASEDELMVSLVVVNRPVSIEAHRSLGRLYLEQNLVDKALAEFLKAVELEPEDPEAYYELGKIYHKKSHQNKDQRKKAISYYEKYLYLGGKEEAEVKKALKVLKKK